MRWLVLGCGYTGTALARALTATGHTVTITRRDSTAAAATAEQLGVRGRLADLSDPATLDVPPHDVVVCLAAPGPDPTAEIRHLLAAAGSARVVYISSTGVYAPGGGAVVDESFPTQPLTPSGHARLAAETALAAAPSWISLRVAGIHGPGRGLVDRIRAGTYRIVGDGTSHVSRIHVDDLVSSIIAAGTRGSGFVNVADDDPAPIGAVADAVAAHFGLPAPPRVPVSSVPPEVAGMLTADRRISNAKLKRDLGVVLRYPSWRSLVG